MGLTKKTSNSNATHKKINKQPDVNASVKKIIETKLAEDTQGDAKTAAVDSHVPGGSNYRVHQEDGTIYSVYLMWSDLKANSNKFYIIQIL